MPSQNIAVTCRWSSAGAQLQWLNASLSSITDEHLLLKSHLQDVFPVDFLVVVVVVVVFQPADP